MFIRFRMHMHHKLLPLLPALEKKNKSPTLWETTIDLELIAVTKYCLTTQGQEKLWDGTKKQEYTSMKSSLLMQFYLYRKFSSHLELCHLVEFCEVILKNLIWERKKKPINDTNGQLPLPTNHFWQWKEEETKKTLPAILEERNKKRITICLWILRWSTTPLHWPMFPIVTQRLRNTARFAMMKYITTYYN